MKLSGGLKVMFKININREDIAEYAAKYSARRAATAYQISRSAVYRSLKQLAEIGQNRLNLSHPPRRVELEFSSCTLIEPAVKYGKPLKGLILLIARDLVSKNRFYALTTEQNKSAVSLFFAYLAFQFKNMDSNRAVDYAICHQNSCYNLNLNLFGSSDLPENKANLTERKSARLKSGDLPAELKTELLKSLPHRIKPQTPAASLSGLELAEQLTILHAHQLINCSHAFLPVVLDSAAFNRFAQFVSPNLFWQDYLKLNSTTFYQSCQLLYQKADSLFNGGEIDRAVALCEKVLKLSKEQVQDNPLNKLLAKISLLAGRANGYLYYSAQAIENFRQAIEFDPANGEIYFQFALYYLRIGNNDESQKQLLKAKEIFKNHQTAQEKCRYYLILGKLNYHFELNYHNAAKNFKKMKESALICNNSTLIFEANGYLANLHYLKRNFAQAEPLYLENVKLAESVNDQLKLGNVLYNLVLLYQARRDFSKAEEYAQKGLALVRKNRDYNKIMLIQISYGHILLQLKKYRQALRVYQELLSEEYQPEHIRPYLVEIYNCRATIYRFQGYLKKAAGSFNQALTAEAKQGVVSHTPYILNQLATILIEQHKPDQAAKKLQKILRITKDRTNFNEIRAFACLNLAKLIRAAQPGKARELLVEAGNLFKGLHLLTGLEHYKASCKEVAAQLAAGK